MDSATDTEVLPRSVSGFGHLRVKAWLAAHRSLTQPSHVLHRLSAPEHPPSTLSNLTTSLSRSVWYSRTLAILVIACVEKTTSRVVKDRLGPDVANQPCGGGSVRTCRWPGTESGCSRKKAARLRAAVGRACRVLVEATGLEPATSCLQSRSSTN